MIDVTLAVNGLDLSKRLSTYGVSMEVNYSKIVTTMDGLEHPYPGTKRPTITFSLLPMTDEESGELYNVLSPLTYNVTFSNPYSGKDETRTFRLTSNLESNFLLLSVDGKRRYRGETLTLRASGVL